MLAWFHRRLKSSGPPRLLGAVLVLSVGLLVPLRGQSASHITYRPTRILSHAVTRHNLLDLSGVTPDSLFDSTVYESAMLRVADMQLEPARLASVTPLFNAPLRQRHRLIHRKCLPPRPAEPDPFDLLI